jgi:hypothetical protein
MNDKQQATEQAGGRQAEQPNRGEGHLPGAAYTETIGAASRTKTAFNLFPFSNSFFQKILPVRR